TPFREGMRVEVNPRMGIDPEIEVWSGSKFWQRIDYSERFRLIQVFVSAEVATYEYDCTGISREVTLLTHEYRSECDRRRPASKRSPRREVKPVEWAAHEGHPTTAEKLHGNDFPE